MTKTPAQVLVRLSPDERKMVDTLRDFYLQRGFTMSAQDVVKKAIKTERAKTQAPETGALL
jgi:hypothetical protein